ncbi:MAG: hypothetical protein HGA86_08375 [Anaerolineaceae bacterium]|nr:hypothetical protein [Anaerolineaceae bacterium]
MAAVVDRFVRYIKIDTQSDPHSTTNPSAQKEFDLARLLADELTRMGLQEVSLDENCYVMAVLPANTTKKIPTIGLIAHMDTSPDFSGANVNPQFHENYDGGDIVLNKESNIVLSPRDFPELLQHVGETLITTDGTTLLGSDDKAGVAVLSLAQPERPRVVGELDLPVLKGISVEVREGYTQSFVTKNYKEL